MRITNQMITDANSKYLTDSLESINKAQKQVNSQKLFDTASENPLAASFSLSLKSTQHTIQTFQDTTVSVDNWMTATDYGFQQMSDLSVKANNLVLSGMNDTVGASDRTSMAEQINGILNQALDAANSSQDGKYLFAGFKTDVKPFTLVDHSQAPNLDPTFNDPITGVYEIQYNGDNGLMQRSINVGQTITQNVPGEAPFKEYLQRLVQAREALKSNDTTQLQAALAGMQTTSASMNDTQGSSASRWRQVQSTSDFLDKSMQETSSLLSQNEDVNLAQGITELQKRQTNYQVVMEVTSRAISAMTLFDYLK
jgi:flagellar hook-associated protein 3 FlgL